MLSPKYKAFHMSMENRPKPAFHVIFLSEIAVSSGNCRLPRNSLMVASIVISTSWSVANQTGEPVNGPPEFETGVQNNCPDPNAMRIYLPTFPTIDPGGRDMSCQIH